MPGRQLLDRRIAVAIVVNKAGGERDVDTLTVEQRSERMGRIRGRDTKPELIVRRLVSAMGFRYRLHSSRLPGKPDLVFRRLKKVIFVHGCFWHRHPGCGRMPKSRLDFWQSKLRSNRRRDLLNQRRLARLGWVFLVVWECELKDIRMIKTRIRTFLTRKQR
jgi:DNA mismatch endonuclease (patch repair protein)